MRNRFSTIAVSPLLAVLSCLPSQAQPRPQAAEKPALAAGTGEEEPQRWAQVCVDSARDFSNGLLAGGQ